MDTKQMKLRKADLDVIAIEREISFWKKFRTDGNEEIENIIKDLDSKLVVAKKELESVK